MNGSRGVYELVYFVKDSKSLERFQKQAKAFDSYTAAKNDAETERLVSAFRPNFSFGKHLKTAHLFTALTCPVPCLTPVCHGTSAKSILF